MHEVHKTTCVLLFYPQHKSAINLANFSFKLGL